MPGGDQQSLSDYEPARPSLAGTLALSVVAILTTALALAVIAELVVISELESGNPPGTFLLDVFAALIAVWVDLRAYRTWRRLSAPVRDAPE
jgi:uncharacterized membrane protein